jgi:hypothetical protein
MALGDVIIIYANMSLAFIALLVNIWASREDHPFMRPIRAGTAALLAVYVLGYFWLLTSGDVIAWSRIMRGVSMVAWPVAWTIPKIASVYVYRKEMRALEVLGS